MSGYYTYAHRRASDDRVFYIGKGKDRRAWATNKRGSQWCKVVKKHGLVVDILATWLTEQEAFDHERVLIASFRGMGYELCNHTDGGDGASGWKHSPETIAKIKASNLGQKRSPDAIANIKASRAKTAEKIRLEWTPERRAEQSKAFSGDRHPNFGKKYSDELRAKLSASHKGQVHESILCPVICVDTGMKFKSGVDAARWLRDNGKPKADGSYLLKTARGAYPSAYGMKWALA